MSDPATITERLAEAEALLLKIAQVGCSLSCDERGWCIANCESSAEWCAGCLAHFHVSRFDPSNPSP